jgi:hypothetical protein
MQKKDSSPGEENTQRSKRERIRSTPDKEQTTDRPPVKAATMQTDPAVKAATMQTDPAVKAATMQTDPAVKAMRQTPS